MKAVVQELFALYDDDPPLAVHILQDHVETGDMEALREGLDGIWMGVLEHHQTEQIPFRAPVTVAFRRIQALVR